LTPTLDVETLFGIAPALAYGYGELSAEFRDNARSVVVVIAGKERGSYPVRRCFGAAMFSLTQAIPINWLAVAESPAVNWQCRIICRIA